MEKQTIVKLIKWEPRVSHKDIAVKSNNDQASVWRLIKNYESDLKDFWKIELTDLKSVKRWRREKIYLLNEAQSTFLITLLKNTNEVISFKKKLVQEFYKMRDFLKQRRELALEYPDMTLAIQEAHDPAKFYHYSNEADMLNKIVTWYSAKKYKEVHWIEIRDWIWDEQIAIMKRLQRQNTALIDLWYSFKDRKEMVKDYYTRRTIKLLDNF